MPARGRCRRRSAAWQPKEGGATRKIAVHHQNAPQGRGPVRFPSPAEDPIGWGGAGNAVGNLVARAWLVGSTIDVLVPTCCKPAR